MKKDLVLSIDQGTTGNTVLIVDSRLRVLAKKNREFKQYYPQTGWVEHDLEEIWQGVLETMREALAQAAVDPQRIAAIGITNQRESVGAWEKSSGKPLGRAIVWQDRRTAEWCKLLEKKRGMGALIHKKTGLCLDPYFSASKMRWLCTKHPALRQGARRGDLALGTLDAFLLHRLSGRKALMTDVSNASRTLLMNLKTLSWDDSLLKTFSVPKTALPRIVSSSEVYATTQDVAGLPDGIPISGMAGDQQAALFGQGCLKRGMAKCTFGTGSFILLNTGSQPVFSRHRMLTTVAWKIGKQVTYALEGSAFIAGAAVQWLRDGLQLIDRAEQIEALAASVEDSGGLIFVPALVGLGAPHWRPEARGLLSGITRATTRAHLARAVLEGMAFLQYDILQAMEKDWGQKLRTLKVDGGASGNDLFMQFLADLLRLRLIRPASVESTALGAALLAGLAVGVWSDTREIARHAAESQEFRPRQNRAVMQKKINLWHNAVRNC